MLVFHSRCQSCLATGGRKEGWLTRRMLLVSQAPFPGPKGTHEKACVLRREVKKSQSTQLRRTKRLLHGNRRNVMFRRKAERGSKGGETLAGKGTKKLPGKRQFPCFVVSQGRLNAWERARCVGWVRKFRVREERGHPEYEGWRRRRRWASTRLCSHSHTLYYLSHITFFSCEIIHVPTLSLSLSLSLSL